MPDTKITALTAISTVDPAVDVLPIVDVSDTTMAASGTTKKITSNQILGAGGTATLASATITGDLTVDTSTLKVDSANNRVGIRTASPAEPLTVDNSSGVTTGAIRIYATDQSHSRLSIQNGNGQAYHLVAGNPGASNAGFALYDNTAAATRWYVDNTGVQTWQNVGGVAGTAMTLNSTGLGVGTSPSYKLDVSSSSNIVGRVSSSSVLNTGFNIANTTGSTWSLYSFGSNDATLQNSFGIYHQNGTSFLQITQSGNVGIGVTPSGKLEVQESGTGGGIGGIIASTASSGGNAGYVFRTGGTNRWSLSLTGSAGAESIRFYDINNSATRMTLDASGNLLVGTTGLNGSWNTKLTLSNDSGTTKWAVGPYLGGVTNFLISAGASAGVYLNGTAATSWTSASDERLKDIIEPISNAIAKVGSLRAVIGKFKFDENNTRKPFLIAQDIQAVLPEAVDASNPEKLGVAYTDVIPLLVAAIKELTAEVNALKNA